MPRVNALNWYYTASQYVASYSTTLGFTLSDPLIISLRGSYGKDGILARAIEVDASLTTAPFTLLVDAIPRVVKPASYSTYNFDPNTNEVRITGGLVGDTVNFNFFETQQIEWR